MDSASVSITDPDAHGSGWREVVGAYVALTKPRIIELLLITTVPAMVLAAEGWPGTWLVLMTLFGGTLSAGGANTLNNYIDRDIDQQMKRTSRTQSSANGAERGDLLFVGQMMEHERRQDAVEGRRSIREAVREAPVEVDDDACFLRLPSRH